MVFQFLKYSTRRGTNYTTTLGQDPVSSSPTKTMKLQKECKLRCWQWLSYYHQGNSSTNFIIFRVNKITLLYLCQDGKQSPPDAWLPKFHLLTHLSTLLSCNCQPSVWLHQDQLRSPRDSGDLLWWKNVLLGPSNWTGHTLGHQGWFWEAIWTFSLLIYL